MKGVIIFLNCTDSGHKDLYTMKRSALSLENQYVWGQARINTSPKHANLQHADNPFEGEHSNPSCRQSCLAFADVINC